MSGIFRAYDIRGKYPEELNEEISRRIGGAFVRFLNPRKIVVGHDMRISSPVLSKAFIDGAMVSGVDITDIGMTTSPALYDAIIEGNFDGGVMVTASHLPSEMNGFKLCREKAIPLSGNEGLPEIESMVKESGSAKGEKGSSRPSSCKLFDALPRYIEKISRFVHEPRAIKMVIDAGNGSIGPEVSTLLKKIPMWDAITMYMEPDGHFPHHVANPLIPSTTRDLQARVVQEKAAIGIAFDGDADRCGFIDETGARIPQDLVTALIAQFILSKEPGATILYDLRSSRIVPETITRFGGRAVRSRVGHSFIKAAMRTEKAVFAGELSGHYYYRDTGFTDNALMTMIQMLNLLSFNKESLSQLIAPLKKYYASGEINFEVKDAPALFSCLEKKYADAILDHLDGLTVGYVPWWFNVRASNTEPVVRLNMEAQDTQLLEAKKDEVTQIIRERG